MDKHCNHNIPETRKGAGACEIVAEIRKRNGDPNWWCRTHGLDASAPDGAALDQCSGAWYEAVPDSARLHLDAETDLVAVWGAVPPTILVGSLDASDGGGVHVHARRAADTPKYLDDAFDIVDVAGPSGSVVVESMAARAFAVSQFTGQAPVHLRCPRCGDAHIDEQMFATRPHRKHQCNLCGRPFFDPEGPSVSNPLAGAHKQLGIPDPPELVEAPSELEISSADFSSIAVWPSNRAVIWTMPRPEQVGVHVHCWDRAGDRVIDDTYRRVSIDGRSLKRDQLAWLAAQREIAAGRPIVELDCSACRRPLTSPTADWITPVTRHVCGSCGSTTTTRLRSFVNPLAGLAGGRSS